MDGRKEWKAGGQRNACQTREGHWERGETGEDGCPRLAGLQEACGSAPGRQRAVLAKVSGAEHGDRGRRRLERAELQPGWKRASLHPWLPEQGVGGGGSDGPDGSHMDMAVTCKQSSGKWPCPWASSNPAHPHSPPPRPSFVSCHVIAQGAAGTRG